MFLQLSTMTRDIHVIKAKSVLCHHQQLSKVTKYLYLRRFLRNMPCSRHFYLRVSRLIRTRPSTFLLSSFLFSISQVPLWQHLVLLIDWLIDWLIDLTLFATLGVEPHLVEEFIHNLTTGHPVESRITSKASALCNLKLITMYVSTVWLI